MPKATWNGAVLAESGQHQGADRRRQRLLPARGGEPGVFRDSQTHTVCPWKGTASYYDVVVDGAVNKDAAWYYPETKDAAKHVKGYVAFWKGVGARSGAR